MARGRGAAEAVVLLGLLLLASGPSLPSVAGYHSGTIRQLGQGVNETVVLGENNWTAYEAAVSSNDPIEYDIQVTNGSEIDLYVVPPNGLTQYMNDASLVFSSYDSKEQSRVIRGFFTSPKGGTIYFIVDNYDFRGAMPTGTVTVEVRLSRVPTPGPPAWFWLVCGLLAVAAFVPGVLILLRQRKKRRAQFPPPGFPVPPPPWPPPPPGQGPPPPPPDQGPSPPPPQPPPSNE